MARNQDRQFGESDSLKNLGAEIPEAEERIPAWAVRPAEENKNEEAAPAASDSRAPEEENSLRRGNAPLFGLNEENGEREEKVKQETADKSRADDAWTREAKRVESTQHQRSGRCDHGGIQQTDQQSDPSCGGSQYCECQDFGCKDYIEW